MNQIFRLKDILYGVRKHLDVIIGMTLGGLLVGVLIYMVQSFSVSNDISYKVYASVAVDTASSEGIYTSGLDLPNKGDFELASDMVELVAYICRSEKVCAQVAENTGLIGVTTKSIQNALSLSQYSETSIVEITLKWGDADEGTLIMNEVLAVLPQAVREVLTIGEIRHIEGPVVTTITTKVGSSVIALMAVFGMLMGFLYCFSQLYMHPTLIELRDVGDVFGLTLLEEIAEDDTFEEYLNENLITNRKNINPVMKESYTALAHIILHQVEDECFSLFATSSIRGEGKTTVIANLGVELAALDKRVLLIDFDLTEPSLGGYFLDETDYRHTVNAVYFDDVSVQEAIIRVSENLYLLPARLDKRHIGIDRFAKKLVSQMESEYDIVLIDTSPVGETSETLYFSNVSNNALFVIRYDNAWCDVIEESLEKLNKTSTSIIGAVVNRVPHGGSRKTSDSGLLPGLLGEKTPFGRKKKEKTKQKPADAAADDFDSDDDLNDDLPVKPSRRTQRAQTRSSQPFDNDDGDDERMHYSADGDEDLKDDLPPAEKNLDAKKEPEPKKETPAKHLKPAKKERVYDDWDDTDDETGTEGLNDDWDADEPDDMNDMDDMDGGDDWDNE